MISVVDVGDASFKLLAWSVSVDRLVRWILAYMNMVWLCSFVLLSCSLVITLCRLSFGLRCRRRLLFLRGRLRFWRWRIFLLGLV